ncbi:MAG: ATP-binding protein [Ignavibacteria bacterium]|nr:ATP-binding protein [Ignavibacteria bacterium]
MPYIKRKIENQILRASKNFPAVILTGARRTGKTTILKNLFPEASYILLEDPDIISRFRTDPNGFLDELKLPVILDEVQNTPDIFNYVRSRIDKKPSQKGKWLITGSQAIHLMRGVTESMTGRAAIFNLMPMSTEESSKVSLIKGGFPEVIIKPSVSFIWFSSYIQTYLERDVRQISNIRDLPTFRRFFSLLASHTGNMLNRSALAASVGVSVPVISQWLNILELTEQIILLPQYFENFGKRIIKSPKIFFSDTGLLCNLLGINSAAELERSPFLGAIFENFVLNEIIKYQINRGKRRDVYYFRSREGLEVDIILPLGNRKLLLIEVKATKTVFPSHANSLIRLSKAIKNHKVFSVVVHRPSDKIKNISALQPGVKALSVSDILDFMKTIAYK